MLRATLEIVTNPPLVLNISALGVLEFWFKTLARDSHFELVAKRAGYPNIEVENRKEAVIVGAVVGIQKVGVVGTDQF